MYVSVSRIDAIDKHDSTLFLLLNYPLAYPLVEDLSESSEPGYRPMVSCFLGETREITDSLSPPKGEGEDSRR